MNYEERNVTELQMIIDAVRRSVDDGAVASFFSLDRLLAASQPAEMREALRADIITTFTKLDQPVPQEAHWHLVYVRSDRAHDRETWLIVATPDLILPGYVIIMACDQDQYLAAQQNHLDIVTKKVQQATFN